MKYGALFILIVAIAGLGIYVSLLLSSMGDEIETLRAENDRLRSQAEQLTVQRDRMAAMESQVDALTQQVRDADAELRQPAETALEATATEPPASDAAEAKAEESSEDGPSVPNFMKMFQGEEGKKMREASARMAVDMQYASLLKDLALPPEVDQQVRDILAASAMDQMEQGMGMMEGNSKVSGKDMKTWQDAATADLRTQLSQVMTADELAQWEVYEADKDRHVMEQSFDMQLNMFGNAMDEDTRLVVRDTLVDQMLASQEELAASDRPMEVGDHIGRQREVYTRTREALATALTEDQYRQADRFLAQQESMLEVSMQMMQGMMGDDSSESPSPPAVAPAPAETP